MSVPNQDKYEKFIVVVNEGSGVIFQPITEEYSYILTAKHTLYEDKETMEKPIGNHKLEVKGSNVEFIEKYEHDTLDIAIVKIKRLNIAITPIMGKLDDNNEKKYDFFGHPNRDNDDSLDNFKVIANKTKDDKKIMIFDECDYSGQEAISGASGGGIFRELDDKIYLIAIEFEMNAKQNSKRRDRRIKAYSIKVFDEIIKKYDLVYLDEERNKFFMQKYKVKTIPVEINGKILNVKTVPVKIDGKILNVSIYPVTYTEYELFSKVNCQYTDKEKSLYPITDISWDEAYEYCLWLGNITNKDIRMLSSEEWNSLIKKYIPKDKIIDYNISSCDSLQKINNIKEDNLGLYNIIGNIKEWCRDGEGDKRYIKGIVFSDNLNKIDKLFKNKMTHKYTSKNNRGFRIIF